MPKLSDLPLQAVAKVQQYAERGSAELHYLLRMLEAGAFKLELGPTVRYASHTHENDETLINAVRPYGYGDFGEVGGIVRLELETRRQAAASRPALAFLPAASP